MTLSPAELLDPSRFAPIYRTCPLCGAEDVHYEFLVERTPFARCSACTLLFANPVRSDAARAGAIIARDVADALLHFGERVLGRPADRVLFVGDSPAEVRGERRELGDLGTAQYDLIVAHGALEFAADPVAAAVAMRERLADDGLLVVLAPSISSREAIRRREDWAHLRRHARWYFDVDTLQLTLTRAGLGDFVTIAEAEDAGAATPGLRDFFGSHIAVFARGHVTYVPRLLSVIVPVYNEASTVAELLDRVLAKTIDDVSIEVVIVESNSSDGSREIVQRYAGHDRVRLVLEERPRGKGYAVRTGLKAARGEVVLFQDADLEYDVNDYDQLVEPLFARRRNFILGSRHDPQGDGWKIRRFDERKSVALTMNLAHALRSVAARPVHDVQGVPARLPGWPHLRVQPLRFRLRDHDQVAAQGLPRAGAPSQLSIALVQRGQEGRVLPRPADLDPRDAALEEVGPLRLVHARGRGADSHCASAVMPLATIGNGRWTSCSGSIRPNRRICVPSKGRGNFSKCARM